MPVSKKLKQRIKKVKKAKNKKPVWAGPEVDGITQSLLSKFLVCRERFRLLVVEGLQPADAFVHWRDYGQMWHICEEAEAESPGEMAWLTPLQLYASKLCQKYKTQQQQIEHWYQVCKQQFPIYVDYWAKHPDVRNRESLLQEEVFKIPYRLPSGRTVRLRGKWDSVDLIGKGRIGAIYLQENKTKGDVNEQVLLRQLRFDLQTMFYFVALDECRRDYNENGSDGWNSLPEETWGQLKGIRYNVVRRPLSGGKYSIKQLKPSKKNPQGESLEEYYNRLGGLIKDDPEYFFMRWKVEITANDVERFENRFLMPILEQLCDWWEWVSGSQFDKPWLDGIKLHWQHPYGVYNPMNEGRMGDVDEYLETGGTAGLERTDNLFPELD